jgi:hypothetical protein
VFDMAVSVTTNYRQSKVLLGHAIFTRFFPVFIHTNVDTCFLSGKFQLNIHA